MFLLILILLADKKKTLATVEQLAGRWNRIRKHKKSAGDFFIVCQ